MSILLNTARIEDANHDGWTFQTSHHITPLKFLALAESFEASKLAGFRPATHDAAHFWKCTAFQSVSPNWKSWIELELHGAAGGAIRRILVHDDAIMDEDIVNDKTVAYLPLDGEHFLHFDTHDWGVLFFDALNHIIKGELETLCEKQSGVLHPNGTSEAYPVDYDWDGTNPKIYLTGEDGEVVEHYL